MTKITLCLFALVSLLCTFHRTAAAQAGDTLQLRLKRNFGYSSLGSSDIQGTFTLIASSTMELTRVVFTIDGDELGVTTEAPHELRFNTDSFSQGRHTFAATAVTSTGLTLQSDAIDVNFVSVEQSWKAAGKIVGPMFLLIFGVLALSLIVTFASGKSW